jgi:hypothetical protein
MTSVIAIFVAVEPAHAQMNGGFGGVPPALSTQWNTADTCAKNAWKKYPDYTPDSNTKREAFRRDCLRDHLVAAPDTPLPTDK